MKRSKTHAVITLLALVTTCLLTACSGSPGETEIQTQVAASLKADGMDDIFEVKNVRKGDGRKLNDSEYLAVVNYDLHFKVGLQELAIKTMREAKGLDIFDATFALEMLKEQYGNFKAGEIQHNKESFLFEKTNKGWQLAF